MRSAMTALVVLAVLAGCGSGEPSQIEATQVDAHYDSSISTKHLMEWVVDPNADLIWGAVGSITTEQGEQQLAPRSDAQWTALRNAAAIVAESGNLLLMPGRARDQDDWVKHAQARTSADEDSPRGARRHRCEG